MASASKHRWRTIFLCMVGAVVFWLLNALNKEYTTEIDYPVLFVVDKSGEVFAKIPPATLHLEVTGSGWRLLRYLLRLGVQPVELPFAKVAKRGQIKSERLYPLFAKKLKDLKVRRVILDESIDVRTISPKPPQG